MRLGLAGTRFASSGLVHTTPSPHTMSSAFHRRPALRPLNLALYAALASSAFAAHAQDAGKLSTVTVTAERVSENIKDVPISVSALRGEALDVINSGGEDLRMLSGRVPSLNIESSFGRAFPRFYIRGYGNTDFRLNASQPVSLILDDVVQENPILKGFPIFDTEAVEVLAGPQGTLFGRNTPAGVVKFDSAKPGKTFGGYASVGAGSYGSLNLEGALNVPLNSDWQARVSAQSQHRDNWVTNTVPNALSPKLEGYDDNAARVQLLYGGNSAFSALFNVHARDLKGSARLFRANIIKAGTNDLVDGFDPAKISTDGKNEQSVKALGASANLTWKLDGGLTLHSITALETVDSFSRGDVDGGYGAAFLPSGGGPGNIPFPVETADGLSNHSQWTQELRLESGATGPLKWQTGLYLFAEKYDINSFTYDGLGANQQTGLVKTHQSNDAWALFGSLNYTLTPALNLRAGLRYTHDAKSLSTDPGTSTVDTSTGLSDSTSNGKVTGDLAASWRLTPETNVYARVATGVRGASIQPASAFAAMSKAGPESSTAYELGVKSDLFNRQARVSADLFHYDVKNQQLTAVGGASNSNMLLSAKKSMGQGLEGTLDAYLGEHLLLGVSGSLNVTRIKDKSLAVYPCAACTVQDPSGTAPGTVLIDGNPLPQAPKYVANVNLRYSLPVANGDVYVYTDWTYRSAVNYFLYQSVEFTGKPLTVGGLRVGYQWGDGKYEVAAFGRNITNRIQATGGIDFNNLTGFINEPRMWGAQFKANF
jgi:iron complex outermembrane recepter protein